jgi:hypothetical protein
MKRALLVLTAVLALCAPVAAATAGPAHAAIVAGHTAARPVGASPPPRPGVAAHATMPKHNFGSLSAAKYLSCTNAAKITGNFTLDVSGLTASWQNSSHGGKTFKASVGWQTTISAKLDVTGTTECTPGKALDKIAVTVPIGAVKVTLHPDFDLVINAAGDLTASQTTAQTITLSGKLGLHVPTTSYTIKPQKPVVTASGTADFDAEVGAEAEVIAGVVGVDLELLGGVHVTATAQSNPPGACVAGYPELHFAGRFEVSFGQWKKDGKPFYDHTWPIKSLAGHSTAFSGCTSTPPKIITTALPTAFVGQPYFTELTTADHRKGSWKLGPGRLPAGLSLSGYTISGKPTSSGTSAFALEFTDTRGTRSSATATIPVIVPGAKAWTVAMPGGTAAVSTPGGGALGVSCDNGSALSPLVDLAETGRRLWSAPGSASAKPCFEAAIADASGDVYAVVALSSGLKLRAYSPTGATRWTVPLDGALWRTDNLALGWNGSVFVQLFNVSEVFVEGFSESSGRRTFDVSEYDGDGLYPYPGGIALAQPQGVAYYDCQGNVIASYGLTALSAYEAYSAAGGPDGTVFLAGWEASCGSDEFSVSKVTPAGIVWTKTDAHQTTCAQTALAATPDGGVILEVFANGGGTPVYRSYSAFGATRWTKAATVPAGDDQFISAAYVSVDAAGNVVLPASYEYGCGSGGAEICSGLRIDFVGQSTGRQTLPPAVFQNSADQIELTGVGTGPDVLYTGLETSSAATGTTKDGLESTVVPGLAINYPLTLQPA